MSGDLAFLVAADRGCADLPVDVFFPADQRTAQQAKYACLGCPVRRACLDYALDQPQYGIWGGTTEAERRALARETGRTYNVNRTPPVLGGLDDERPARVARLAAQGWTAEQIAAHEGVTDRSVYRLLKQVNA